MSDELLFPIRLQTRNAERQAEAVRARIHKKLAAPIALTFKSNGGPNGLGQISSDLSEFDKSLKASSARVLAFGATTGVIFALQKAFRTLVSDAADVEKQLKDIQVILGSTTGQMKEFSKGLFDVARATGQSFSLAAEAAAEFSRQGLGLSKTLGATQAALTLVRISGVDAESAVQNLTAAVNTFNKEGVSHTEVVAKMIALDVKFAVSAQDLAEGLSRAGSVASDTGVSLDELNAAITSVQEVTARGGAVIGNGFKSIATRLQRAGVRETLEGIGVGTQQANGELRGTIDVLRDLANTIDSVGGGEREGIIEKVGGVFQINTLRALLNQLKGAEGFSAFDDAKKTVEEAGSDIIGRNEELNESFTALVSQTRNSITEFNSILGEASVLPPLEGLTNIVKDAFDGIIKAKEGDFGPVGESIANSMLNGIRNVLSGPAPIAAIVLLGRVVAHVAKDFGEAFKSLAGLTKGASQRLAVEEQIRNVLSGASDEIRKQILGTKDLARQTAKVNDLINQGLTARAKDSALVTALAKGVRTSTTGLNIKASGSKAGSQSHAQGSIPLSLLEEQFKINQGVGGATRNAKPIMKKVNIGRGLEKVAVNNQEAIVKNFMGTGQDAVLTPDMLRKIGGVSNIRNLSFADGTIPHGGLDRFDSFDKKFYENLKPKGKALYSEYLTKTEPATARNVRKPDAHIQLPDLNRPAEVLQNFNTSEKHSKPSSLAPAIHPQKQGLQPQGPVLTPAQEDQIKSDKRIAESKRKQAKIEEERAKSSKKIKKANKKANKKIEKYTKFQLNRAEKGSTLDAFGIGGGEGRGSIKKRGLKAGLSKAQSKALASEVGQRRSEKFNEKIGNKAFVAGIATSFIGGAVEDRFRSSGNEKAAKATAGVTTGISIAATGAGFGPVGAVLGALAGSAFALNGVFEALTEDSEKLIGEFKELQESTQADFSAFAAANNGIEKLDSLIAGGASEVEVRAASRELTAALNNQTNAELKAISLSGDSQADKALAGSAVRDKVNIDVAGKEFVALAAKIRDDQSDLFSFITNKRADVTEDQSSILATAFLESRGGSAKFLEQATGGPNGNDITKNRILEGIRSGSLTKEEIGVNFSEAESKALDVNGLEDEVLRKIFRQLAKEASGVTKEFVRVKEEAARTKAIFNDLQLVLKAGNEIAKARSDAKFDITSNRASLALKGNRDLTSQSTIAVSEFQLKSAGVKNDRVSGIESVKATLA